MRNLLYILLLMSLFTSSLTAQDNPPNPAPPQPTPSLSIDGPATAKRDDFNDFKAVGAPEKCTYDWLVIPFDHKLALREFDNGKTLTVVGPPGVYTLVLSVSDGTAKQNTRLTFSIPGTVDPTPEPPKPIPVTTLRTLAGDKADAVGKVYADLLTALGKGLFTDLTHFKATETQYLELNNLVSHGASAEIAKRLSVKDLAELKAPLEKVVAELSTPTPVPSGKRHIVILHETADDTAEQARIWNLLRTGDNAAYLKSKGHTLDILDDDSVDGSGDTAKLITELKPLAGPLPFLFILDAADGRPLHKQQVPATASQVMEVIKSYGG